MEIVVCIKQVPDTDQIKIDPETHTLVREGVGAIVNPLDLYAVEEALRLRDAHGGRVTALTMGPPQAEAALRECLMLGVDRAVQLTDRRFAGGDTWATSLVLARAITALGGVDLVLTGKQAADGDTAQVGPGIAAHLDWPQVTYVRHIREVTDTSLHVERLLDEGAEVLQVSSPCVLSVLKEINEPRWPSLAGKLASMDAEVERWGLERLGLSGDEVGLMGSPTQVSRVFPPPVRGEGRLFRGNIEESVSGLVDALSGVVLELRGGGS
jgi:electron transfer flavoprotein beta subunit